VRVVFVCLTAESVRLRVGSLVRLQEDIYLFKKKCKTRANFDRCVIIGVSFQLACVSVELAVAAASQFLRVLILNILPVADGVRVCLARAGGSLTKLAYYSTVQHKVAKVRSFDHATKVMHRICVTSLYAKVWRPVLRVGHTDPACLPACIMPPDLHVYFNDAVIISPKRPGVWLQGLMLSKDCKKSYVCIFFDYENKTILVV